MEFMHEYKYYMRIDDDSRFTEVVPFDPFLKMVESGFDYVCNRPFTAKLGFATLTDIISRYIQFNDGTPWLEKNGKWGGKAPYNNFHVSSIAMWNTKIMHDIWGALDTEHAFFKYRVGDASVHAVAMMTLEPNQIGKWWHYP
jgi:hypothetical protein